MPEEATLLNMLMRSNQTPQIKRENAAQASAPWNLGEKLQNQQEEVTSIQCPQTCEFQGAIFV